MARILSPEYGWLDDAREVGELLQAVKRTGIDVAFFLGGTLAKQARAGSHVIAAFPCNEHPPKPRHVTPAAVTRVVPTTPPAFAALLSGDLAPTSVRCLFLHSGRYLAGDWDVRKEIR